MEKVLVFKDQEIVEINGKICEYDGCGNPATSIAENEKRGRPSVIGFYCEQHTSEVSDYNSPEYSVSCPNCGCRFGVN